MTDKRQKDNTYIMEDPREKRRLADKVDADHWVAQYLEPRVEAAACILDVGCGPAVLAGAAARRFFEAQLTGIEQSDDRFAEATRSLEPLPNAKVVQGNACAMPFDASQFDFVYTRFMLEYLPQPEQAIREMVRVALPGGKVMLQDLDGQLVWHYPVDEELQAMIETVLKHMAQTGFDPFIGRKLYSLAVAAGLVDICVEAEPYHFYAGRIDDDNYRLWELKLDIALPIMEHALDGREAAEQLKQRFLDYLRRDDTMTYSTVFTVTGTKAAAC
jgi:SAM-dependent methyltransferase